jgi:ArsR family transcriptional regulator
MRSPSVSTTQYLLRRLTINVGVRCTSFAPATRRVAPLRLDYLDIFQYIVRREMDESQLVKILKALGDRKRLRMMRAIAAAGELSCGQVRSHFNLSQPTISHHLKILADAGVIAVREAGQHHFISVNWPLVRRIAAFLPAGLMAAPERTRARAPTARANSRKSR